MRKNSVRKWLHAILDLLPLFVIPIFAIYTRNENYNSNIEIEVQQNKEVNFNQLENGIDYVEVNTSYSSMNYDSTTNNIVVSVNTPTWVWGAGLRIKNFAFVATHKYLITFQTSYTGQLANENTPTRYTYNDSGFERWLIFTATTGGTNGMIGFNSNTTTGNFNVQNLNLFDLTYMFGVGNEPTYNEFRDYFPNTFYSYTQDTKTLISDYQITYNDTDVGSQFVYTLYNATDKYFNCTNLFNLEQVWNWVQLNLFGGNAPLMVYVVWQIIVYEFFMDLIFLLYSVFMFIIDFATNTLERFYRRSC